MELVEQAYEVTVRFPKEGLYGLTYQARRASVANPLIIAEGQSRGGNGEFHRFLSIAHGSSRELETQHLIADCLHDLDRHATTEILDRCPGSAG